MSLNLDKLDIYADPYDTNWDYLRNLTWLQMKALKEMEWNEKHKYIHTDVWVVPLISFSKWDIETSVEYFINHLNAKIKEL